MAAAASLPMNAAMVDKHRQRLLRFSLPVWLAQWKDQGLEKFVLFNKLVRWGPPRDFGRWGLPGDFGRWGLPRDFGRSKSK